MKRYLFTACALVVAVGMNVFLNSCNPSSSTSLPGAWDKIGDFAGIPRDGAVGFVINDIAYVGTGYNANSLSYLTDFWKYDPSSDSWYPAAKFPGVGRSGAVAFALNGKGYVGTGYNLSNGSNNPLSDFWEFDPSVGATGKWSRIADFGYSTAQLDTTVSARYGCGAFVVGGRAFVGWGEDVNQFDYKDLWEYDATNNVWIQRPDTGSKRVFPFIFVIDNIAYVGGGFDPAGGNSFPVDFNRFDVTQLKDDGTGSPWSGLNGLTGKDKNGNAIVQPKTRQQGCTFSIAGLGYVTTGSGFADIWQYTPPKYDGNGNIVLGDTWLQYFSLNTNVPIAGSARTSAVGFTVNNTYGILTTGGSGNLKFDDCWRFNPVGIEPDNK